MRSLNVRTMKSPGVRVLFVSVAVFAISFGLSMVGTRYAASSPKANRASREADSLRAVAALGSGRQLIALVIVSSSCGFCQEKQMKAGLRQIRTKLQSSQGSSYSKVSVVGIAIDDDIRDGIGFLRSLGPYGEVFDEISAGRGWLNEFITDFVWRDGIGKPATPQVILLAHTVDASRYPDLIDIGADSVIRVIVGRDSLLGWIRSGTPG